MEQETPAQNNILETLSTKKIIIVFVLMLIACVVALYPVFSSNSLQNNETQSPPYSPPDTTATLCAANPTQYTVNAEALQNPQAVCNLTIDSDERLKTFLSVDNSFADLHVITISNLTNSNIPRDIGKLQSLVTLQIMDVGEQSEESSASAKGAPTGEAEESLKSGLPKEVGNLTNLRVLYLAHTDYGKLPAEIGNLHNLTELYILYNPDLRILPVSVAKLSSLKTVIIQNDPNLIIPASLFGQKNLEKISVTETTMQELPSTVYALPNLTSLVITNAHVKKVSVDILSDMQLQIIDFSNNDLQDFPDISKLAHLQEISLGYNHLSKLPAGLEKLKSLKALRISDNNLNDAAVTKLQQLTGLQTLDLGNNKLTKIPDGLGQLKKIQYLRLLGNAIDKKEIANLRKALPQTTIVY